MEVLQGWAVAVTAGHWLGANRPPQPGGSMTTRHDLSSSFARAKLARTAYRQRKIARPYSRNSLAAGMRELLLPRSMTPSDRIVFKAWFNIGVVLAHFPLGVRVICQERHPGMPAELDSMGL